MRRLITKAIVKKMLSLYRKGKTLRESGEPFGFKAPSVYYAFIRNGIKTRPPEESAKLTGKKFRGDKHWNYGPKRSIGRYQYRSMRIVDADGQSHKRRTHVIMIEKVIGRRLFSNECVHHINGNNHDNRLENLRLMTRSEHTRLHNLQARKTNPQRFNLKRDRKSGRYVPDPSKPWSRYK